MKSKKREMQDAPLHLAKSGLETNRIENFNSLISLLKDQA